MLKYQPMQIICLFLGLSILAANPATAQVHSEASMSQNDFLFNDEDTILVEKEMSSSKKIPYHRIVRKIAARIFTFDSEDLFSFGKGKTESIIRTFNDISDRTKCRIRVDQDEVVVRLSVNL